MNKNEKHSLHHYLHHYVNMINPEQRATYYKKYIDKETINLSTAENILLLDFYQEKAFKNLGKIEDADIRYPENVVGDDSYRQSIAKFLRQQWDVSVDHEDIYATSGVSAALECLAFSLCNEEDEVLIPAPMWYGFPWSLRQRPKLKFIPFQLTKEFTLTLGDVKKAIEEYPNAKLLILTNPNNPLGVNYSKELLNEIYSFFLKDKNRHIISDEIYGCSQINKENKFISALKLDIYKIYNDRIHVVWGLSKDFGLSGFRVGFIISKSVAVRTNLKGNSCTKSFAWFSPLGSLNHYMLKHLFITKDEDGHEKACPKLAIKAMNLYHNLLKNQYKITAKHLEKEKIKYRQGNEGAIFFWIDLREYLNLVPDSTHPSNELCNNLYKYDDIKERRLAQYILKEAKVHLIRGQESFCKTPGYFRLCYTSVSKDQIIKAIDQMSKALNKLRKPLQINIKSQNN